MVTLGINKVRLTGGEPLMRPDLEQVIAAISSTGLIRDLSMTTNAQTLAPRASALKEAGLMRINISLDSLNPDTYREITGGGSLDKVFEGIDAALACGLSPVKLNCVVMRGTNDADIGAFISFARDKPVHVRFIEFMPIGTMDAAAKRVPTTEILAAYPELTPVFPRTPVVHAGVASVYAAPGFRGTVGFISPITKRFCDQCNRIRVTPDGKLRPCLGDNTEVDLRPFLAKDHEALLETIRATVYHKPEGHHFRDGFTANRTMNKIGG
jgi:cyclic pyranopterin phosphate synthase